MSDRITQSQLNRAIERLNAVSGLKINPYNCYGYSQLMTDKGQAIEATYGDSKKDLYYQIQFYLRVKELERKAQEIKK